MSYILSWEWGNNHNMMFVISKANCSKQKTLCFECIKYDEWQHIKLLLWARCNEGLVRVYPYTHTCDRSLCTPAVWLRQLSWPGGVEGACVLGSGGQADRSPGIRLTGLITLNSPSKRQTPADLWTFSHPSAHILPLYPFISLSLLISLLGKLCC